MNQEVDRTLPKFIDKSSKGDDQGIVHEKSYLLAISGPYAGTVFTLDDGSMVAGREPGAEILLNDTQVSRKHAEFVTAEGETKIVDLNSTNGTFVNGDRVALDCVLAEGDEIQLGVSVFRFSVINPVDGGRLGLISHGHFENRLSEELDRAHRYKRPLSLLMIGMNVKDGTEDQESHLRHSYPKVVNYIRKIIRTMDLLAHYGKYELELLLPETEKEEALKLAERITGERFFEKTVFLSVGLASFPLDGTTRDTLIEKSRKALREARQNPNEPIVQVRDNVRRIQVSDTEVIIKSEKMQQLFELAERIAKSTITVLIQGETGVGKEVIAESIHGNSDRKSMPLVCINCAALTETLLESELFGHEKGAFTGADNLKIGLFESAGSGTIFLDEVGEMPLKTQAKLLRVLQSKKIMRVGSNREIDTDVRVVAATNRKLEDLVAKSQFREDLYYRLNAATITVPPLRERKDEIPYLAQAFIESVCHENRISMKEISPDAMEMLSRYHWPGNIRELKNTIERAVIIADGDTIYPESITNKLSTSIVEYAEPSNPEGSFGQTVVPATAIGDMKEVVSSYEKNIIVQALKRANWNQTKAADMLQIPRRTLVSKIKKYKIKRS
ncbi:MAG: sigma 54-interacting transcriptional regulator [Bdellovibrionales bacterium]|nr:sigma 54-interacting transcriptional regulator [Bdellovibrionales bacterium]